MTEQWKSLIMLSLAGMLMLAITPDSVYAYHSHGSNAGDLRKSEIRISKFETNSNDQNSNDQNEKTPKALYHIVFVLNFENLDFGFVSDFVLRASNLNCFLNSTVLPLSPGDAPTTPEVREEHQKILQKYYGIEEQNKQTGTEETSGRIESRPIDGKATRGETPGYEEESSFSEFLESLGQLPLPVILIIIAVLVILFYLAFRGVPGAFRKSVKPSSQAGQADKDTPEAEEKGKTGIKDKGYAAALELAKNKEYGKALVVLHKTSVKKLQEQRLIPGGFHFTNNDIKQLIQDSSSTAAFLNPFAQLAAAAERAAFRKENPGEATYIMLKKIYENSFLKMNGIR